MSIANSRFGVTALILTTVLAASRLATAGTENSLDSELQRVVSVVKKSLKGATEVRIEPFSDLSAGTRFSGAIRTGITASFSEECQRQGLTENNGAAHIVQGRILVTDEASLQAGEPLRVELHIGLVNRKGLQIAELLPLRVNVEGQIPKHFAQISQPVNFLAEAVGMVGAVPAGPLDAERVSKLALKPTGVVKGSLIQAVASSPYQVEILSRQHVAAGKKEGVYQPLPATVQDGYPFVDIPIGHEYQIRVSNHSDEPIAVATSIDGLNTFHFSTDYRDPLTGKLYNRHYFFEPHKVGLVPGWHFTNQGNNNVGRFLVSNYGDSAAQQIGIPQSADSGAIHLQICNCVKPRGRTRGRMRGKTRGIPSGPSDNNKNPDKGTEIGESDTYEFETTTLRPGRPVEFLTIRYDR